MKLRTHRSLLVILGIYLVLAVAYSVVNPILESPDEALYYDQIRYLTEQKRLPVLEEGQLSKGHHPPLYFVVGAAVTGWLPNQNFAAVVENGNPFWAYRHWEAGVDNKSLYLHDPAVEGWPYRDVALGVHLLRWLSVLFGAGIIVVVYLTSRELFPSQPWAAVVAAGLVAFNPMFLYIQSSVHDDALVNLLGALTIYTSVLYWRRGPSPRRAVLLGALCGLGALTKINFLALLPMLALVIVVRSWLDRAALRAQGRRWWRQMVGMAAIAGGATLLIAGWWFVRNQLVYGEPTSMGRQMQVWGIRENAPDVRAALRELGFLRDSFWGIFGYGQIPLPGWLYLLLWAMVLAGFTGFVAWVVRSWRSRTLARTDAMLLTILAVAPIVGFASTFWRMTVSATADFGRYLFLSYAVLAPFLSVGLTWWLPGKWRRIGTGAVLAVLLVAAVGSLVGVLRPVYAPPPILASADGLAIEHRLDAEYPGVAKLLGYSLDPESAAPGETVNVTVYWQVTGKPQANFTEFVQLIGDKDVVWGGRDTHPGLGRYPTKRWLPGQVIVDTIPLPIAFASDVQSTEPLPTGLRLDMGLHENGRRLPTSDGRDTVTAGLVRLAGPALAAPAGDRVAYRMGDAAELVAIQPSPAEVSAGSTLPFTLTWQSLQPVDVDYVVFVHVRDASGKQVAQYDSPPQGGRFPTHLWQPGDVVVDDRQVPLPAELPPGEYTAVGGWYRPDTGERLPVIDADGKPVPDASAPLFSFTIRP